MRTGFVISALLATATAVSSSASQQNDLPFPEEFPTLTIDLGLEPRQRFKPVAIHFHEEFSIIARIVNQHVPKIALWFLDLTSNIWKITQPVYYDEILGMCEEVDSLTMGECVVINILYEVESFCTSVIAKKEDGTILHGRMMDFSEPSVFRQIVYNAEFVNGDDFLFNAVMFGGTIGVYTGSRPGAFNLSLNQRYPETNYFALAENILMTYLGTQEISWLNRNALAECDNYQCAYEMISKTPVSSKSYIALSGVSGNEGVIITRDNLGMAHVDHLGGKDDAWYLVQTNDDHWKIGCNTRCAAASERIEAIGRENITLDKLAFDVLMQEPNLNDESIYVATYSAMEEGSPFTSYPVKGEVPFVQ